MAEYGRSKDMFKNLYDSDEELTAEERKKIRNSRRPNSTRKKIWEDKGVWDKTKKMMKGAFLGDKRADKKTYGK